MYVVTAVSLPCRLCTTFRNRYFYLNNSSQMLAQRMIPRRKKVLMIFIRQAAGSYSAIQWVIHSSLSSIHSKHSMSDTICLYYRCACREKKKFTWDWHAWNLALVSTPSLLLAYYLHGVEKQMHEEAAIREEIQERTGVSSRGFLIPKREVREEVLGMLSAGNQHGSRSRGNDDKGEVKRQPRPP